MRRTPTSAVIYARLSRDIAGTGLAVARQEEECREFCERHGWEVADVFVDNDMSATSGHRRDGFERLLASMNDGVADVIVAWHQDRLLRLSKDLERVIALDVPIHTVSGGAFDLTTPAGRAVAKTVAAWSQYETEQKALRQKSANRQRAHAGKRFSGGARIFGWEEDRRTLHPVESEAIRSATLEVTAGTSLNSIARQWNAKSELKPPRKGQVWTAASIRSILLRQSNAGYVVHQGERVPGVVGEWDPIVSAEKWEACLAVLSDPKRRKVTNPRLKYFLSGLAKCGVCGDPMRVGTASVKRRGDVERHQVFRCKRSESHSSRSAAPIMIAVEEAILERLASEDASEIFRTPPSSREQQAALLEIERIRDRMLDAEDDYAKSDMTGPEFRSITNKLREQLEEAQKHVSQTLISSVPVRIRQMKPDQVRQVWESLSVQDKRKVAEVLLTVTIYPTTDPKHGSLPYGAQLAWI